MKQLSNACCAGALLLLTACGGGGGGGAAGGSTPSPSSTPSSSPASSYQSLAEVTVPAGMNWKLSSSKSIPFTVKYTNNSSAAGVVIKLFTYSTSDPHAAQAPSDVPSSTTDPVALSLIDTLVTDGSGQASWQIDLPVQLGSVLAVISDGTNTSSQIIQLSGPVTLSLAN